MSAEEFYKSDKRWWVSDDPENWRFAEAYLQAAKDHERKK
jgi:hypothetical protein